MDRYSFLRNLDLNLVDALWAQYDTAPDTLEPTWRAFFDGVTLGQSRTMALDEGEAPRALPVEGATRAPVIDHVKKEIAVLQLITSYRMRGHLFTKTNPVRKRRQFHPTLDLENFGLSDADLGETFQAGQELGLGPVTLRDIIAHLQLTYCQSIGVEYRYMADPETVEWLRERMEACRNQPVVTPADERANIAGLVQGVYFERFLHTKFVGQKRFSLEGAESVIPALHALLAKGSELGCEEFSIGMSHRGRLTVLVNILDKPASGIFAEFEGQSFDDETFEGDVKYHLGFSGDRVLPNHRTVHLSLAPNPSHLEAVDPVVQGIVRAKLDRQYGQDVNRIAPILIHGDAATAGQGIVYEVIQMSQLAGYKTGGTVHVVINNQVGFTTNYIDGRSSVYCTDVAKVTRSPVFHVNGDDVEAVIYAVQLAMEFRQRFHRDVFIDLSCYRKYGHNEADEPRYTQPLLYKLIEQHPNPLEIYLEKLRARGSSVVGEAETIAATYQQTLDAEYALAKAGKHAAAASMGGSWKGLKVATADDFVASPETAVDEATLRTLGEQMSLLPGDLPCFPKIRKLFADRRKSVQDGTKLDWALGEWLAYATLLADGTNIRISGQDVKRGTFAHRHAAIALEDSEAEYVPLNHLGGNQGRLDIYNSLLSEYAVMGFEFGFALADPRSLVIWEAQFGDFANGAQIIIDQFLSCSETKWHRSNGLVLLLPHGCEGQGPEHSSARLERYLQLCAGCNMQVIQPTTPANLFHALRRQMARPFRKPLVVMTPKSLLRHPLCVSPLADFARGGFCEVLDDATADPKKVRRVLCCTGKIYFELLAARDAAKREDVAIVRLEQMAPFPRAQLTALAARYKKAKQWVWVQEEPLNMGAWSYLLRTWDKPDLQVVARKESGTPATGYHKQHVLQQQQLIDLALADLLPSRQSLCA